MLSFDTNRLYLITVFSIDSKKIKTDKICSHNPQQAYDYLGKMVQVPEFSKKQQLQVQEGQFDIQKKGIFRRKTVVLIPEQNQFTFFILDLNNSKDIAPQSIYLAGSNPIELITQNNTPVCSNFNEKLLVKIKTSTKLIEIMILVHYEKYSVVLKLNFKENIVNYCRINKRSNTTDPYTAYQEYLSQERLLKETEINTGLAKMLSNI